MAERAGVHATAVIEPGAVLGPGVAVGPYAVVGPQVRLGANCEIGTHAVLLGDTELGPGNRVGAHAVVGGRPQIRGQDDEKGALRIGEGNSFREFVTVHVGGARGRVTRIGSHCLLMAYSHVAHDCELGDHVELANGVQLAGHVVVDNLASLGGLAAVHQFARVGTLAFVGAGAMVSQDVLPYCLASGDRAQHYGLNVVGLKRRGIDAAQRRELARALKLLFDAATLQQGVVRVEAEIAPSEAVAELLAFARGSRRGLCRLRRPAVRRDRVE